MKKRVWKRATEIAADLMGRMGGCVEDDPERCPYVKGLTCSCEHCIEKFLVRRAKQELAREAAEHG